MALAVGNGFGKMVKKAGYRVHACSIVPVHSHLVVMRHTYSIEQVCRLMRQAATAQLLKDKLHPFADRRTPNGKLPSVWGEDFWRVFLYTPEDVVRAIRTSKTTR